MEYISDVPQSKKSTFYTVVRVHNVSYVLLTVVMALSIYNAKPNAYMLLAS